MSADFRAAAALMMAVAWPAAMAQAAPASPAASATASSYRSAFDGYRRFNDQPVGSWREANDLVGRIGGWQVYAREGQGGAANPPAAPASGTHPGHKTP